MVLQRLTTAGLRLKQEKCEFLVPSISYLGHKIDSQGLHPLPDKIDAIVNGCSSKITNRVEGFPRTAQLLWEIHTQSVIRFTSFV